MGLVSDWMISFKGSVTSKSPSISRHLSARRLEIPSPVCCQNCFANGNASDGKRTMCRVISFEDIVCDELSLGLARKSHRRAEYERFWDINSRHASAIFLEGNNIHLSPNRPNFFSHNEASFAMNFS